MTPEEAVTASKALDATRVKCPICQRYEALDADKVIFLAAIPEPGGGERPDLCWDKCDVDPYCKSLYELRRKTHTLLDTETPDQILGYAASALHYIGNSAQRLRDWSATCTHFINGAYVPFARALQAVYDCDDPDNHVRIMDVVEDVVTNLQPGHYDDLLYV